MISSGELFVLTAATGGELRPLPMFLNKNIRVVAANLDSAYVACEPTIPTETAKQPCQVWRFRGDSLEPTLCYDFDLIEEDIRQIAVGEKHILVLTHTGTVYSQGAGNVGAGHGGAREVPDFRAIPALKGRNVKLVAAGPQFSVAVTHDGDVYSWGFALKGESGMSGQVDAVPRFAAPVAQFRVAEVSCGNGHVVARTDTQQCVTWGENTCGQLGLGQKAKPTHKPQVIDTIPTLVSRVAAGWAHSVVISPQGHAFAWGLNSHGQLGLGDTTTRYAPHLLHDLHSQHKVEHIHAARTFTVFRTSTCNVLLCGRVPGSPDLEEAVGAPRRQGDRDPPGCLLAPTALPLASGDGGINTHSCIGHLVTFDQGIVGFARSAVYRVSPNVVPVSGGSTVSIYVTGLPYKGNDGDVSDVPVKVRLRSNAPLLDVVVPGVIADMNTVEFVSPNVMLSPLGTFVDGEQGSAPVQLQVSVDNGLTWTSEASTVDMYKDHREQEKAVANSSISDIGSVSKPGRVALNSSATMRTLQAEIKKDTQAATMATTSATLLWFSWLPSSGPTLLEPDCAPVTGGTELLIHVQLPPRIPTNTLTVRFRCLPKPHLEDKALEDEAPMRQDAREIVNPDLDAVGKLPLVGTLDVLTIGWLDAMGLGVRCRSPPINVDTVPYYDIFVELSLDGRSFMQHALQFNVYDLHVTGVEPNIGPSAGSTEVSIQAKGFVKSASPKVRLYFPDEIGFEPRELDASYDDSLGKLYFIMPSMTHWSQEALEGEEELGDEDVLTDPGGEAEAQQAEGAAEGGEALAEEAKAAGAPEADAEGSGGGTKADEEAELAESYAGMELIVELSIDGQNFTEDRIAFGFHGRLEATAPVHLAQPDGRPPEVIKEETKPKGKAAKKDEVEAEVPGLPPGSKFGCEVRGTLPAIPDGLQMAAMRGELLTKVGEEEMTLLRPIALEAQVEHTAPPPAPPPSAPEKAKKGEAPVEEPPPEPRDMLCFSIPAVQAEELPEGASLYLGNLEASLNGQSFVKCAPMAPVKVAPIPRPVPVEEEDATAATQAPA
mmetsp:Transcript_17759/g.41184  ORF Transcript_17759/g.41184 Transcript_17759/m.41184 type:complete len:1052 (+) Transcript_17759:102-3257(+)